MNTKIAARTINAAAMAMLTAATKAMATTVAMHGGNTFHTNMFSSV